MFSKDSKFRAYDRSTESTKRVEQARANGEILGYMYGLSRKREEELLRIRDFRIYSK